MLHNLLYAIICMVINLLVFVAIASVSNVSHYNPRWRRAFLIIVTINLVLLYLSILYLTSLTPDRL
jgi:hypothetical protein